MTFCSIKLYAWEKAFSKKVLDVRNDEELKMIQRIGIVNSISNFFWSTTPFLCVRFFPITSTPSRADALGLAASLRVAFASFTAYAYTSPVPLTSDVIFPAISLFALLSFPLAGERLCLLRLGEPPR